MTPPELLKTIYLGDRGCKSINLDGWNDRVVLTVSCLSRVRSTHWDYYTAEDIIDGMLVFDEVGSISFDPPGYLPNDFINSFELERPVPDADTSIPEFWWFLLSIDHGDRTGRHVEVRVRIAAQGFHIEDPRAPGVAILD